MSGWHTLHNPINASQLLDLPWGTRSYWLQPWRSSLTTRPASVLANAIGINFNVTSHEAPATAKLLGDSGFRRARLEIPWNAMSYSDPSRLASPAYWVNELRALRANHLRPLILLNGNAGGPTPSQDLDLNLAAPALAGARTIILSPSSAAQVIPGLTGIDEAGVQAKVLITSVVGRVATLSQPLPNALASGLVPATTLRFAPFGKPFLADGRTPNPRYESTLTGWLQYVQGVCDMVRDSLGSDNFDVEVWNELGFGSEFLSDSNYYNPLPDPGATGDIHQTLVAATIAMLHDPQKGLTHVQVGDGFTNQVPWGSGSTVPPGTAGLDKHPYRGAIAISPSYSFEPTIKPIDALGGPAFAPPSSRAQALFPEVFTPRYRVFMPEYFLTGIQTETLMRDLSPYQTSIQGTPHGAGTHPPGSPAPKMWITEDNLDQQEAQRLGMPAADMGEMQAKAALRFFVSYASEGASAIDLFAAKYPNGCCQILSPRFFAAVDQNPSVRNVDRLGGRTTQAVRRLALVLGHQTSSIARARQLTLTAISQQGNAHQFEGNGTMQFPALYNRDVLSFFPFQISAHRFASAVYVMTSDLTHRYSRSASRGRTPFDLPPEQFRLTIGNLDGRRTTAALTDPLTGRVERARIISRLRSSVVVQVAATDSPEMLVLDDSGNAVSLRALAH